MSDAALNERTLDDMRDRLAHRGPDDSGTWSDASSGVGLAHTRLSILDLSAAGHQPMESHSSRFCVTFNGEIYNYRALNAELQSLGFTPRGSSDTEVFLAAFDQWGVEATLPRLSGMFALAVWDRKERVLYLARDRMGEKPLFFGWLGKSFVFASELKALRAHPGWNPSVNSDALALFMRYAYVPAPFSIYQDIYKLPPGCFLSVSASDCQNPSSFSAVPDATAGVFAPRRYWSLKSIANAGTSQPLSDPEESIVRLETTLSEAISDQMVADVPLGAFLSGGVDSSTVVALMQKLSSQPVKTFTIGFDVPGFDEAEFARRVAEHLGTNHTELYVTGEQALNVIPTLPHIYDEPHADASQIPSILVSQLAREHVTVAMSGDGGDELFCGYNRYMFSKRIWKLVERLPGPIRRSIGSALGALSPTTWERVLKHVPGRPPRVGYKLHRLADAVQSESLVDVYKRLISYWPQPERLVTSSVEPTAFFGDENRLAPPATFVDQMCFWDQIAYLPDDNLAKMDRASMSVGLESRAPLLDHNVVSLAWQLDNGLKIQNGASKWILRQVLYRHVPRELIERPKMGFSVPVGEWLRGPLKEWSGDLLNRDSLVRQGFFDADLVQETWNRHISGRRDEQNALWAVLMFQAWHNS